MPKLRPYNPDADAKDTRRTQMNAMRGSDELWQSALKTPLEYVARFEALITQFPQSMGDLLREMQLTLAQSHWSRTRGVYTFDPALSDALAGTPIEGLQDDVFARLPEWGVYISVEEDSPRGWLHGGFVAALPQSTGLMVMVAAVFGGDDPAHPYSYNTVMFWTEGNVPRSFKERYRETAAYKVDDPGLEQWAPGSGIAAWHERLLLLAAYLCTEKPDLRNPRDARAVPQRKRHNGPVQQWEVGVRFGNAYRRALEDAGTGSAPTGEERQRPRVHVRRGHWHTVLSGPRNQERAREVRWFPPTLVNAEGDELPVTLWRQR